MQNASPERLHWYHHSRSSRFVVRGESSLGPKSSQTFQFPTSLSSLNCRRPRQLHSITMPVGINQPVLAAARHLLTSVRGGRAAALVLQENTMALFGAGSIYSVPFTASVTTAGSFDLLGVLAPNNSQVVLRSLTLGAPSRRRERRRRWLRSISSEVQRHLQPAPPSRRCRSWHRPHRHRSLPDRSSPDHPRGSSQPPRRRSCIAIVGHMPTGAMSTLRTPATSRSSLAAMSVRDCMFGCRFRTKPSPWPSNGTWECLLRRPWPGVPARSRDACRYVEERQVSRSADAMRPRETAYRSLRACSSRRPTAYKSSRAFVRGIIIRPSSDGISILYSE